MTTISRKEARKAVFELLFAAEFQTDQSPEAFFEAESKARELPDDAYIRQAFFGVTEKKDELDAQINRNAKGWTVERISRVSRSILRLAAYEMCHMDDIPVSVSMNEAVELCKTFDEEKARPFLNGVLSGIKNEIGGDK